MNLNIEHFLAYVFPGSILVLAMSILFPYEFPIVAEHLGNMGVNFGQSDTVKSTWAIGLSIGLCFAAGHALSIARRWGLEPLITCLTGAQKNDIKVFVKVQPLLEMLVQRIRDGYGLDISDINKSSNPTAAKEPASSAINNSSEQAVAKETDQSAWAVKAMELALATQGGDPYRVIEGQIRARIMTGNLAVAFLVLAISLLFRHSVQIGWGIASFAIAGAFVWKSHDLAKRQLKEVCLGFLSIKKEKTQERS